MRSIHFPLLLCGLLLAAAPLRAESSTPNNTAIQTESPATPPSAAPSTPASPDTLYDDPSANSSVTVTQILPNSSTSMSTYGAVRRIRVTHDILVIEWGTTATTLLPRQFVGSLTVNKRADPQKQ